MILVGFDGSPASEHALAYAAGLSRRTHGSLLVAYIAPDAAVAVVEPCGVELTSAWLSDDGAWARELVEDILGGTATRWEFALGHGDAAAALRHLAEQHRGDVLVVGQFRTTVRHVLGSVPARLARHARCPITVVP